MLVVSQEERADLGVPSEARREEGIIVECAIPEGKHGRWKAVRRRPDRRNPNCLKTVLDTLALNQKGYDEAAFLNGHLAPLVTKGAFDAWLAILRRRILWEYERERRGQETAVEVHGAEHRGYGECTSDVGVGQVRLALPLEGHVRIRAFFSLTDGEVETLFSVLRTWLTGGPRRALDVVIATQTLHEGLSRPDARYFGTFMESSHETLLALATGALGRKATLTAVEGAEPPELLQLPPMLSRLASATYLLRGTSESAESGADLTTIRRTSERCKRSERPPLAEDPA
jgi:hypothetical protein